MRRFLIPLLAALLAASATAALAVAHNDGPGRDDAHASYAIGLWGDLPYNDEQKTVGLPNLIADMNRQRLAFTAHDGDLKAGSGPCPDSLYTDAKATFNTLDAPAVFTPGDNDWTDCDRNPGVNSAERLDFERKVLFSTPFTLGRHKLRQEVQDAPYVENRRWSLGGVTYATLNVQGSCNNLCDTAPDPAEYAARNAADIAWLHETFAEARAPPLGGRDDHLAGRSGLGRDRRDPRPARDPKTLVQTGTDPDGYHDILTALRDDTTAFRRPVAVVHGDSHYFRIDKPFLDAQGRRLENFTRVETFGDHQENGDNDVHWLRVDVDPRSREVFSFQPQIVPANRTAVPAPAR